MNCRAAIVVRRLAPYHKARFRALGPALNGLLAVELCARDETYSWERQGDAPEFERVTLFEAEKEMGNIPRLEEQLSNALDRFAPDCVAVPGWSEPAALLALRWARKRGVATILMSDSQEHDQRRNPLSEYAKRIVVANASAAFVAGRTHANYIAALGMESERISLGYDVVDNEHFARGADAAREDGETRLRLGLPARYLLCVARFVAKKNLLTLAEAYRRYREAVDEPPGLVIVGDGPMREALTSLDIPGLEVRPFASYEDLPAIYGLAEAVVLPSVVEQWGLVINEAMAAGCAVLASNRAGATAELIDDGRNGLVVAPDRDGLVDGLLRLEAADKRALGDAARNTIAGWGLDRFVRGFSDAAQIGLSHGAKRMSIIGRVALAALARRPARLS